MADGKLYYWGIKARSYAIMVVAKAGGLDIEYDMNPDLPGLKPILPFGQLPYYEGHGVKIAQGCAILRFIGHKAGLNGATDQERALSEMLIEENSDLFNSLAKANSATDKAQAYNDLFAEGGYFKTQLAYLEKIHSGEGPFFINGDKRCTGGYALACILDMSVTLEPTLLDGFPKIKAFYTAMLALPEFADAKGMGMYFARA